MKNNMVMYIVAGVAALLVVVGVGGATAYVVLKNMGPAATEASGPAEAGLGEDEKPVALKPFVTNLGDADHPRYINVTFEMIARDEDAATKLQDNMPLIRDAVVEILNTRKSMEVTGQAGTNKLKTDIQEKVNSLLGGKHVQKVLITDFAVQF